MAIGSQQQKGQLPMTNPHYKRHLDFLRRNYANVVATLALFVALTGVGLVQAGVLVTSKQIRNGTILSQDIHKAGVKTSDIKNGTVESSDIGAGEVEPEDVTMPDPEQLLDADVATANVGADFALVDAVGTFTKDDPTSELQVDWTGTANAPSVSCVFQLRVDGQPAAAGAGLVYVGNVGSNSTTSVSVTALFPQLAVGNHTVEVWARAKTGDSDPCVIGPAEAGIPQTFVVSELVI
jgi:hypothetical protein